MLLVHTIKREYKYIHKHSPHNGQRTHILFTLQPALLTWWVRIQYWVGSLSHKVMNWKGFRLYAWFKILHSDLLVRVEFGSIAKVIKYNLNSVV